MKPHAISLMDFPFPLQTDFATSILALRRRLGIAGNAFVFACDWLLVADKSPTMMLARLQ